jgi:hypothetical protein
MAAPYPDCRTPGRRGLRAARVTHSSPYPMESMGTCERRAAGAARPAMVVAGLLAMLAAPAGAQQTEPDLARQLARAAANPVGADSRATFGAQLPLADAAALLREMREMTRDALRATRAAEQAGTVAEVRTAADRAYTLIWGMPSGMAAGGAAEAPYPGWKEQWQVTGGEFSPSFAARYGTEAPRITDPRQLGVLGRGRAVRNRLVEIAREGSRAPAAQRTAAEDVIASLNNTIGWMYLTEGFKGREAQPRVSLTHVWDAPPEFWNSAADTGWFFEVEAQASNILRTDYGTDVAEARTHLQALSELLAKVLRGVDADGNGRIEARPMEGGLDAAFAAAAAAGLPVN